MKPQSTLDSTSVIQFFDPGWGETYKNLSSMYIVMKVRMEHIDDAGKAITTEVTKENLHVVPINNLLHSMFRQVVLTLNGKQVGQNTQNYAYVSYLQQLMTYENVAAAQHIAGVVFELDKPNEFDNIDTNVSAVKRGLMFQPGEEVRKWNTIFVVANYIFTCSNF